MAKNNEGNTSAEETPNLSQNLGQVDLAEDEHSTTQITFDLALAPVATNPVVRVPKACE